MGAWCYQHMWYHLWYRTMFPYFAKVTVGLRTASWQMDWIKELKVWASFSQNPQAHVLLYEDITNVFISPLIQHSPWNNESRNTFVILSIQIIVKLESRVNHSNPFRRSSATSNLIANVSCKDSWSMTYRYHDSLTMAPSCFMSSCLHASLIFLFSTSLMFDSNSIFSRKQKTWTKSMPWCSPRSHKWRHVTPRLGFPNHHSKASTIGTFQPLLPVVADVHQGDPILCDVQGPLPAAVLPPNMLQWEENKGKNTYVDCR